MSEQNLIAFNSQMNFYIFRTLYLILLLVRIFLNYLFSWGGALNFRKYEIFMNLNGFK